MKKRIIVANWKENPLTADETMRIFGGVKKTASRLKKVETVICLPTPFFPLFKPTKKLFLGAQDCSAFKQGAYTGEVSPWMLKDMGAEYVILGHSERRAMGETDEVVNQKLQIALKAGLKVILCVGENKRDREGGYLREVRIQFERCLSDVNRSQMKKVLIAYEPVWAISTYQQGAVSPEDSYQMSIFIRRELKRLSEAREVMSQSVIYGGSVSPDNAGLIMKAGGIDGFLIGHESLNPKHFNEILAATDKA